jgi:hypothetical protein
MPRKRDDRPKPDMLATLRMECELLEAGIHVDEPIQWQQPATNPPPRFRLVARDDGWVAAVNYAKEMTDAQIQQGDELIRTSDIRPREARSRRDLAEAVIAWIGNDAARAARVAGLALAWVIRDNPLYGRRNGVPVDGGVLPEKPTPQ